MRLFHYILAALFLCGTCMSCDPGYTTDICFSNNSSHSVTLYNAGGASQWLPAEGLLLKAGETVKVGNESGLGRSSENDALAVKNFMFPQGAKFVFDDNKSLEYSLDGASVGNHSPLIPASYEFTLLESGSFSSHGRCTYVITEDDYLIATEEELEEHEAEAPVPVEAIILTKAEERIVEYGNRFAWHLFEYLSKQEDTPGNFVISPMSLTHVLGMIDCGAAGKTQEEINAVLGVDDLDAINEFCHKMLVDLPGLDMRIELAIANAVLVNEGYPVYRKFINLVRRFYHAQVSNSDLAAQATLDQINAWCSQHTNGLIPAIIDHFEPATQLCFLNAAHFKAPWSIKFDPKDTAPEEFFTDGPSAGTRMVPMMHMCGMLEFFQREKYDMLELDLGRKKYAMHFYLPAKGCTIQDMIGAIVQENQVQDESRRLREVEVKIPRFDIESDFNLNRALSSLGMPSAFVGNGGFANISGSPDLRAGLIRQKATFSINEDGAEASSITLAELTEKGGAELTFHANRPFVYTIVEKDTGIVLFAGCYRGE